MAKNTFLFVGLGNPGAKYEHTRHNIGFKALDKIVDVFQISNTWKAWQMGQAEYIKTEFLDNTIFLLKPLTYMNLSGKAVSSFARFFKIKPSQTILIYDDISLELGTVRMRKTGSAGGHNGVQDVIQMLGTQDIPRLKLGIGPKPHPDMDTADFVLSKFKKDEQKIVEKMLKKTADAVSEILKTDIETAMTRFN